MVVAGVDGCRFGWVCVMKDSDTNRVSACLLGRFDEVLAMTPRLGLVAVDVPIGLVEAGHRECDVAARRVLGPGRASSVFPAPVRAVLGAREYREACAISEGAHGKKISKQTFAILSKIREVDEFLCGDLKRQSWVREVHPEVCFWAWNGMRPMLHKKKSSAGKAEREALVEAVYGEAYRAIVGQFRRKDCGRDDVLDAFAALWTAERIAAGLAIRLPAEVVLDSCGLRMEIVA